MNDCENVYLTGYYDDNKYKIWYEKYFVVIWLTISKLPF